MTKIEQTSAVPSSYPKRSWAMGRHAMEEKRISNSAVWNNLSGYLLWYSGTTSVVGRKSKVEDLSFNLGSYVEFYRTDHSLS